jgi:2-polyprenyl-3-methyl-5-hydroxy-6-metoxy-1,4-benzoquinol methylase
MSISELESASGGTVRQTKYLKKNPLRRYLIGQYLRSVEVLATQAAPASILDVGCGEGFVVKHLRETVAPPRLDGLDIDRPVLDVARFQNRSSGFARASVFELPFPADSYDLVLCNEVLEHLEAPERALGELARVSRGHLILSVPREPHYRLANMAAGANWPRWGDDADHCQRWTRGQFHAMARRHFSVVDTRDPFPWVMVLCRIRA